MCGLFLCSNQNRSLAELHSKCVASFYNTLTRFNRFVDNLWQSFDANLLSHGNIMPIRNC